jgi:hypothetical protein
LTLAADAVKVLQADGVPASKPRRVQRLWLLLLPWSRCVPHSSPRWLMVQSQRCRHDPATGK